MSKPDISDIPHASGCYIYKDKDGTIIYIGKAKDLKRRVSSYFTNKNHNAKTKKLVESIDSLEYIITNSDEEAYLLENTLIKKHQPKYNIDLRDAKSYAYIILTKEEFPRIGIARSRKDDYNYFGPFVSGKERDYCLSVVKKTFKLRSCRNMAKNKRPCLRYHIGSCLGPCTGNVTKEDYAKQCEYAQRALGGETKELSEALTEEMNQYSKQMEFESAIVCREMIAAVENLSKRQYVERKTDHNEDVVSYRVHNDTVYLMVFHVYKGTLGGRDEFIFPESSFFFDEFLTAYYSENQIPKEIITEIMPDESPEEYLSNLAGHKVVITVPKQGAKKNLVMLAGKNIESVHFGDEIKVTELQNALHMKTPPNVIECFDISHLFGTDTVASMVRFRNGRPEKRSYRRYKIKTVDGIDDYASIAEAVGRRYRRLIDEESEMPDLILIDGGKGQLSYAKRAIDELNLKIPLISLAESEEEVFITGVPFPLPFSKKTKANMYLQEIRDEAHRFAVEYNRLLRRKRVVK
ncbi:MAG TPA: excinuclease ABC subunit UvrC [Methanocorpusculum sp.]|nr:excinuclease ABC subunit UvrC [Methanocorpusculum sp.]